MVYLNRVDRSRGLSPKARFGLVSIISYMQGEYLGRVFATRYCRNTEAPHALGIHWPRWYSGGMGSGAFRPALCCVHRSHRLGLSIGPSPTPPCERAFRTAGADYRDHAMPACDSWNLDHGLDPAPACASYGYQVPARAVRFLSGLILGFVALSGFLLVLWKARFLVFDGQLLHGSAILKYALGWGLYFY